MPWVKLTEDVRGQLTSRIALHYLLPELTKAETEAILRHALDAEVTEEMIEQIHQVTGGNFRSVDMTYENDSYNFLHFSNLNISLGAESKINSLVSPL